MSDSEGIAVSPTLETDFTGTNETKLRQKRIREAIRHARETIVLNTRHGDDRKAALQCLVYAQHLAVCGATARPRLQL